MARILKLSNLLLILILLNSCSLAIRKIAGIHNPVVETPESIERFLKEQGYNYSHNYIVKSESDSVSIFRNLFLCGEGKIMLFDSKGQRYCYANSDSVSCPGNLYTMAFSALSANFIPCVDDTVFFTNYLERLQPIIASDVLTMQDSSYYLIYYWSKFLGGKKGFKENLTWLHGMQKTSPNNIIILAVNTDLQESWGLVPGKKLKMKLKIRGHGGSAEFGQIPYKLDKGTSL